MIQLPVCISWSRCFMIIKVSKGAMGNSCGLVSSMVVVSFLQVPHCSYAKTALSHTFLRLHYDISIPTPHQRCWWMYVSQSCFSFYICNVGIGNRNSDLPFSHFSSCSHAVSIREFFSGMKGSRLALLGNWDYNTLLKVLTLLESKRRVETQQSSGSVWNEPKQICLDLFIQAWFKKQRSGKSYFAEEANGYF